MAENKKKPVKKLAKSSKKEQTVRQRAESAPKVSKKRVRNTVKKAGAPIKFVKKMHSREYHLPLPDNKVGRFLKKRVRLYPKFFAESFREIKLVTWPNRRETLSLTMAVFLFALIFATIIGILDLGLSKTFEKFIVK